MSGCEYIVGCSQQRAQDQDHGRDGERREQAPRSQVVYSRIDRLINCTVTLLTTCLILGVLLFSDSHVHLFKVVGPRAPHLLIPSVVIWSFVCSETRARFVVLFFSVCTGPCHQCLLHMAAEPLCLNAATSAEQTRQRLGVAEGVIRERSRCNECRQGIKRPTKHSKLSIMN